MELYEFIKNGQTKELDKLLLKAYLSNVQVIGYILGLKEMLDNLPKEISIGEEDEEVFYMSRHWKIWKTCKGGFDCL